ncbi:MAG: LamG-like jellyroll fold domain-containing protein [Patescibacteria group bacterium]
MKKNVYMYSLAITLFILAMSFGLMPLSTQAEEDPAPLYSHWAFDEGIGDYAEDSGTGNVQGQLGRNGNSDDPNDPTWKGADFCLSGGCLYFDGNNDYVNLGLDNYIHNGTSSFSISIWAKGYGYQDTFRHSRGAFFGWMGYEPYRGVAFGPNDQGDINFWTPIDPNTLTYLIVDDLYPETTWNHWVAVYDAEGQEMIMYKNAKIIASIGAEDGVPTEIFANNNVTVKIGDRGDGLVNFNGYMDEVKFFASALSEQEVEEEFNSITLPDLEIEISNIQAVNIEDDSVTILYETNIPTDSIVKFREKGTDSWSWAGDDDLTSDHEVHLTSLSPQTIYEYYITAKDKDDRAVDSSVYEFVTTYLGNDDDDSDDDNETEKGVICHREGQGAGKTIHLPENAIKSHLRNHEHDYRGECTNDIGVEDIKIKVKKLQEDMLDEVLEELQELRDIVREQQNEIKYLKDLISDARDIAQQALDDINQFITYGVDENTKKLGEGERAAVIHSYSDAFGKLPETTEELEDAFKIANGRWPGNRSERAEERARERFREIYARAYNENNPNDNAAITVMAYGLRQKAENRNLKSEEQGIETFKALFGKLPESTEDWNIMQAITYSGATRDVDDADSDGLSDRLEDQYGTDPNNPDTDGDGYGDGQEVVSGYSPI